MSLHTIPLTLIEKTGLVQHGLSIDKPSMLSDCFRLGIDWALKSVKTSSDEHLWLDVESRLPSSDNSTLFLISYIENNTRIANLGFFVSDKQHWYNLHGKIVNVTHWMPLPSLPC